MADQAKPRGKCPECGRSIQLKTDGTVRHHGDVAATKLGLWPPRRCEGTGKEPRSYRVGDPTVAKVSKI